jgi:hypothetical protein
MSGGSLPRTGIGVVTIGGVAGIGGYTLPLPVAIALGGVAVVLLGALLVRLTFRRKRPVGAR